MQRRIQLRIVNRMTEFDLALSTDTPFMTAGAVIGQPTDLIERLNPTISTNGGVYSGTGTNSVRGVVAYDIPGGKAKLIIYFDTTPQCRLLAIPRGETITDDLVDVIEGNKQSAISGPIVVEGKHYTFTASARSEVIDDFIDQGTVNIAFA